MSPYVSQKKETCIVHECMKDADVVIVHKINGFYQAFCFEHAYWYFNTWHKPKKVQK